MSKITLIAAIGKNRELGRDNQLIWSIPEDLNFFKGNTLNKYIVMGVNTYFSLPKKLLNRKYIVLTHHEYNLEDDVVICHNISELLEYIKNIGTEIMVIGGASVYKQMIDLADKMLLTEIDDNAEASVYFPEFSLEEWEKYILSEHVYNGLTYKHVKYIRKKKIK